MSYRRKYQSGAVWVIVIVGILLIIAATLLSTWWNTDRTLHATRCQNDILSMQTMERQYRQSVADNNPDAGLCAQINDKVRQYNTTCGEDFGNLPEVNCG